MKEMNSFTKRKAENGGECVLTESELTFDKKFKQLFLKKEFLAPILKNVVLEYKEIGRASCRERVCMFV